MTLARVEGRFALADPRAHNKIDRMIQRQRRGEHHVRNQWSNWVSGPEWPIKHLKGAPKDLVGDSPVLRSYAVRYHRRSPFEIIGRPQVVVACGIAATSTCCRGKRRVNKPHSGSSGFRLFDPCRRCTVFVEFCACGRTGEEPARVLQK